MNLIMPNSAGHYRLSFLNPIYADGQREALRLLLDARGLPLSESIEHEIITCDNNLRLCTWVRHAAHVETVADLFGQPQARQRPPRVDPSPAAEDPFDSPLTRWTHGAGMAESLLHFLDARDLPVSPETATAITKCGDRDLLRAWITRAPVVANAEDLYAESEFRGMTHGMAKSLLILLRVREIPVSETEKTVIIECSDADLLIDWITHAPGASSIAQLLR